MATSIEAQEQAGGWKQKPPPSIAVIILAAGASTRMGRPKQLLTYGGSSFLRHAAKAAVASVCRPLIVVLGAYVDQVHDEIDDLPVEQVMNERWAEGMGWSIQAGLNSLNHSNRDRAIEAVVLMLCDQPLLTTAVINDLVTVYRSSGKGIVASEYGGTVGVPVLFARRYFAELEALSAAAGAKHIIAAHSSDVDRVPFAQGIADVDTPEDYLQLQRMLPPHASRQMSDFEHRRMP